MLKRAASRVCNKPALELSKRPALIFEAQGASPSMRERRINRYYDALFTNKLQPQGAKGPLGPLKTLIISARYPKIPAQ
jgi:hypothetical protein